MREMIALLIGKRVYHLNRHGILSNDPGVLQRKAIGLRNADAKILSVHKEPRHLTNLTKIKRGGSCPVANKTAEDNSPPDRSKRQKGV